MITDTEKDIIFNEMVFNKGLYYYSDTHKENLYRKYKTLEDNFETNEDFKRAVHSLLHLNGLHFYSKLRFITNEVEFIRYIQSQFDLYNEYTPNNSLNWLNFTKKCIMYSFGISRINNTDLKASFMKWYNEKIKTLPTKVMPEAPENNLTISGLALKYFYEGIFINRESANKYLEGTEYTSGDKLYNEFIKWSDYSDRKSDPESLIKLKNKIKLFETVIDLLPEDKKGKAIDELIILKSFISKYQ